jgi:hypothetical protein
MCTTLTFTMRLSFPFVEAKLSRVASIPTSPSSLTPTMRVGSSTVSEVADLSTTSRY